MRLRLRAATRAAHAELEAALGLSPASLTRARYGRAVQVLHAVRVGWEPGLDALLPGWGGQHREWLAADLRALGLPAIAAMPALPLAGPAEAWGAQYVLEGSALGGVVLARAATGLGLSATAGARYFAGAGSDTGRRWGVFLEALDGVAKEEAATEGVSAGIVRGAVMAFREITGVACLRMRADRLGRDTPDQASGELSGISQPR